MSSTETAEKLLTKLSGFLISWAIPAVSWPSEASFSVWTRRSCAVRKSSSDFASSRVRASTLSNKRAFWIATTDWAAKVFNRSMVICELARHLAPDHQRTHDGVGAEQRNDQDATIALAHDDLIDRRGGFVANVGDLDWLTQRCGRPNGIAETDSSGTVEVTSSRPRQRPILCGEDRAARRHRLQRGRNRLRARRLCRSAVPAYAR